MPEEIKQKDKLKDGFEDLVINDTGKNFDDDMFIIQDWWLKQFDSLLSQALQKRDEDLRRQINENTSDGFHTFKELYEYRLLYNAGMFNNLFISQGMYGIPKVRIHKSKKHSDGELCFGGGWFIVMADLPTGQISNHYELKDWDLFQVPETEVADKWDGHTPQDVADRLRKYLLINTSKIN